MNNHSDEEWFGRKNVFNVQDNGYAWKVIEEPIVFSCKKMEGLCGFSEIGNYLW